MISPLVLSGFVGFLALVKKNSKRDYASPLTIKMDNQSVNNYNFPTINQLNNTTNNARKIPGAKGNKVKRITCHFIHIRNNRISQLDLKAKKTFIYIAFIYLMFMIPTLISFISVMVCLMVSPTSCSSFMVGLYLNGVIMDCLHSSIVNPIAYVLFSKDLFAFFKSRVCRNPSIISKQKLQVNETSNQHKMTCIGINIYFNLENIYVENITARTS